MSSVPITVRFLLPDEENLVLIMVAPSGLSLPEEAQQLLLLGIHLLAVHAGDHGSFCEISKARRGCRTECARVLTMEEARYSVGCSWVCIIDFARVCSVKRVCGR